MIINGRLGSVKVKHEIDHTGNTFRKELAATRINIEKELLKTTKMSLNEIAQYGGYKTYTGFYKATKKDGFL